MHKSFPLEYHYVFYFDKFSAVGGSFESFINVVQRSRRVLCNQCLSTLGSYNIDTSWTRLTCVRFVRIGARYIQSICSHHTVTNGRIEPHSHYCIMVTSEDDVNVVPGPPEVRSTYGSELIVPPCRYAMQFKRESAIYPLRPIKRDASTQTIEGMRSNGSTVLVDQTTQASIAIQDLLYNRRSELGYVSDDLFWRTLQSEPSSSRNVYSPESVQRAIRVVRRARFATRNASNMPMETIDLTDCDSQSTCPPPKKLKTVKKSKKNATKSRKSRKVFAKTEPKSTSSTSQVNSSTSTSGSVGASPPRIISPVNPIDPPNFQSEDNPTNTLSLMTPAIEITEQIVIQRADTNNASTQHVISRVFCDSSHQEDMPNDAGNATSQTAENVDQVAAQHVNTINVSLQHVINRVIESTTNNPVNILSFYYIFTIMYMILIFICYYYFRRMMLSPSPSPRPVHLWLMLN